MNEHKDMVNQSVKKGHVLVEEMTPDKAHLNHMSIGLAGEVGELLDAIKKMTCYNQEIDMENVVEELGDIEFYLEGIRSTLGVSRNLTLKANINKLSVRYPNLNYSNEKAKQRLDKESSDE